MAEEIESTDVTEGEVATAPPPPPEMHGALLTDSRGQTVLHPDRASYVEVVSALRDDGFVMCVDLCAVDYLLDPPRDLPPGVEAGRFEVVVNLLSLVDRERLRLRVQVRADDPRIPSIVDLHPGVETAEREAYDMFGILFTGHPDLSRILMPDDWEGHPLRKDYATGRIPVQFRDAPGAR